MKLSRSVNLPPSGEQVLPSPVKRGSHRHRYMNVLTSYIHWALTSQFLQLISSETEYALQVYKRLF